MAFELTWYEGGVDIHVDGDFPNQMVAINKALTRDPRCREIHRMLFDVLDADTFYADKALVGVLAEIDVSAYAGGPRMRVAVVTNNTKMKEIVKTYAGHYERLNPKGAMYQFFDNRVAARAWLGEAT